jgi:hypothetical protein
MYKKQRCSVCPFASIIFQNTERIAIKFGQFTRTIEAGIKVNLRKEIDCEKTNWTYLAVDGNWWRFL